MTDATRFVRRNKVNERNALAVAAVGGIVTTLAGASPTGSSAVDVALVALFAGLVVWASASAPWWAVSAAAGIGAVIALDPIVAALGFVGFGLGMWVGVRRRDLPEIRAVVGAIAVNVLIRSDLDSFLGLSAIVGITVCVGLFVMGVWRRPSVMRRRAWIGAGALCVMTLLALVGAGVTVLSARSNLTTGSERARDGISALNHGEYQQAAVHFEDAARLFGDVDDRLGGVLAAPALLVPAVAQNVSAGADLSAAASAATATAASALRQIEPDRLTVTGGLIDVAAFEALETPLLDLQAALDSLRDVAADLDSPWLVGRLQDELVELDDELAENEPRVQTALEAVRFAPQMLGADEARRYLIMFTSPAELRGLAGFFGNYAEVTINDGAISVDEFGRRSDLERYVVENGAMCTVCSQEVIDRYGPFGFASGPDGGVGPRGWSNITLPANFPTVGEVVQDLYPQSGGSPIDGVISMDPYVVEALMAYSGPIDVEELGVTVDPSNASEFLLEEQYALAGDGGDESRIDGLESLGRGVIEALLTGALPPPTDLARDLGPLVEEHRLLVWTDDRAEQAFLDGIGMLGAMPSLVDDTGFAAFAANAGASKIDVFLSRDVSTEIVTESDGSRTLVADVTLTNSAPASGLPDYVIGNAVDLPTGTSRLVVTFYGPQLLTSITVDGAAEGVQRLPDSGWTAYSLTADIGPGESSVFHLEFDLPAATSPGGLIGEWVQPIADRDG